MFPDAVSAAVGRGIQVSSFLTFPIGGRCLETVSGGRSWAQYNLRSRTVDVSIFSTFYLSCTVSYTTGRSAACLQSLSISSSRNFEKSTDSSRTRGADTQHFIHISDRLRYITSKFAFLHHVTKCFVLTALPVSTYGQGTFTWQGVWDLLRPGVKCNCLCKSTLPGSANNYEITQYKDGVHVQKVTDKSLNAYSLSTKLQCIFTLKQNISSL